MAEEQFNRMLEAMPKIAEAVKDLPAELQQTAFEQLVRALNGGGTLEDRSPTEDDLSGGDSGPVEAERVKKPRRRATGGGKKAKTKQVTATRNINFWPTGKTSLPDLVKEKRPSSNFEKNLVVVWWFEETSEVTPVGVGEVLAGYKAASWRAPADPVNSLQVTSSHKHWLDTSDMSKIKTTHSGRNHVEHDMPAEVPPKKIARKATKRAATKATT